uniref:Transposase n=1 Tax=Globodera rostochiensis TaxID=31243 RepID=A0A914HNU5_GLORO
MEKFWFLILAAFFATNSQDKAESVKLEHKTFDEIFGEGWWDKGEAEDLKTRAPTNFGQNVHHQIDRQNTQIGQNEPNSTDQFGQIEPNSTDQNPPLTESDHSDNANNCEEQSQVMNEITYENIAEDERKRKIVDKFHAMRNEYETVAKELGLSFVTIYNWKKELDQITAQHKNSDSEQKELMKLYYEIKEKTPKISDKDIAKILKIGRSTLYKWKSQFKQQQLHPNSVNGHSVEENAAANVQEIGTQIRGVFD